MIAGDKAPDFTLYDHTGRPRTLSALLSDGPVVLFFFPIASSPICTAQACHFRDLSNEFAMVGAQRVGISTDTVDKQAHFAQQRSFDYPLLSDADGVVSELFGVRRGRFAKLRRSVVARDSARRGRHTRRRGLLLTWCAHSRSGGEVAARLSLAVGAARFLVGDLVTQGYLQVHAPLDDSVTIGERRELITRTLRGLRAL